MAQRYFIYFDDYSENLPSELNSITLIDGSCFDKYYPITQLSVQALPNTKFYINYGESPCIVGHSGKLDLSFLYGDKINRLCFDKASIDQIKSDGGQFLLINIIYQGE